MSAYPPRPGSPEYEDLHRECIPLRGQLRTARAEIEELREERRALRAALWESQTETAEERRETMRWRWLFVAVNVFYWAVVLFLITR